MPDLIDYMPILIFGVAGLFLILFFRAVIKGIKKDKKFVGKTVSIAQTAKRFEVLDGRKVVAFPCSMTIEPNKATAILNAMTPGTTISDAEGNQYVVEEYLKKYSLHRHLFNGTGYYLVFSIRATGDKVDEMGLEFTFEKFKRENAERKAAVKAGVLSEAEYIAWLEQQKSFVEQEKEHRFLSGH